MKFRRLKYHFINHQNNYLIMGFKLEKGAEIYVHAVIQKKGYDEDKEQALYKKQPYVTTPREFTRFLANRNGMKIREINHMPKGYEIPKPKKLGEDPTKREKAEYKLAMEDYEKLCKLAKASKSSNDSPEAIRLKDLKKLDVEGLDKVLAEAEIAIEGNKTEKIKAIMDAEFPKS